MLPQGRGFDLARQTSYGAKSTAMKIWTDGNEKWRFAFYLLFHLNGKDIASTMLSLDQDEV